MQTENTIDTIWAKYLRDWDMLHKLYQYVQDSIDHEDLDFWLDMNKEEIGDGLFEGLTMSDIKHYADRVLKEYRAARNYALEYWSDWMHDAIEQLAIDKAEGRLDQETEG